jgi:hypothetical protein
VFDANGNWYVALSTGSAFAPYTQWMSGFGLNSVTQVLGDVDGDGKADAAVAYYSPSDWYVEPSNGSSFKPFALAIDSLESWGSDSRVTRASVNVQCISRPRFETREGLILLGSQRVPFITVYETTGSRLRPATLRPCE